MVPGAVVGAGRGAACKSSVQGCCLLGLWARGWEGSHIPPILSPAAREEQFHAVTRPCHKTLGHPPARGSPWSCAPGACSPGWRGHPGHVASPRSSRLTPPGKPPVGVTRFDPSSSERHRGSCPWPPCPDPRLLGTSPGSARPVLAKGTEPEAGAMGTRWQKKPQQSRVAKGPASSKGVRGLGIL